MVSRLSCLVAALAVLLAACSDDGAESPVSPTVLPAMGIQELVSGISVDGVPGVLRGGPAPAPGGGPTTSVSGNSTVVNGGTLSAGLVGSSTFETIYVYVGSSTVGLATVSPGGIGLCS